MKRREALRAIGALVPAFGAAALAAVKPGANQTVVSDSDVWRRLYDERLISDKDLAYVEEFGISPIDIPDKAQLERLLCDVQRARSRRWWCPTIVQVTYDAVTP